MLEKKVQAVVRELYVLPQHRGKGIASKLVEAMEKELASKGITVMTSEFPTANFIAERFYKAKGFRPYTSIYLREV
jgi:GNAT superfamily N-acetyltransferase